jgi:hypothetical protein
VSLVENKNKISAQTDKVDKLLKEIHVMEENATQTRRDLLEANSIMKNDLLTSTSNIITKETFNLKKQIGLQIAARDGWIVNQISTPIETLDKALTINTQIECQIVEEQRDTKEHILNELKDNTNSIIAKIVPPVNEILERMKEGLITLIHDSDAAKDTVLR